VELLDGAEPAAELAAVVVAAAVDELVNRVEVQRLDRAGIRRGGRGVGVAAVVLVLGGASSGGPIAGGSIIRTVVALAVARWLAAAAVGVALGAATSARLIIRTFLLRLALPGVAVARSTLATGGLIAAAIVIRTLQAVPAAIGPLYR
jgi:hypothetical protein